MKAVFTTSGKNLDAQLDPRFGRAPGFIVVNLETGTVQSFDNQQNLSAAQGAGIQSAEAVARLGAHMLVTGHCGPKAYRVLQAAGVKVFTTDARTVRDALGRLRAGSLAEAAGADVEAIGHEAAVSFLPASQDPR
jgi:predicted Fe-Mo cluster-binding NifX family protein